ncbi:hypothetical protein V5O48_013391 [Marasmius crinis-equi]|uniref:Epidermal growth factor receptor-like transmembrane-juxtamembrane segment domain-containing protein n=1 Tax=Marasmius crinis-equi TaxID=585013 RepID=A0ABR3F077_9AGAR
MSLDSSKWRKPAFTTPLQERVDTALAALERTVRNLTSDGQFQDAQYYYQTGLLYSQMAEFDLVTNQTRYKERVLGFLRARDREREVINPFLRDGLAHGYAAARSYLAYNDSECLNYAINWWQWAERWTITDAEVASGSVEGKDFTLQSQCSDKTVAGGTFDASANRKNSVVSLMSSGYFLTLSSLLREATSNQTYLDYASSSFNFIRTHLLPTSGYLPQHSIPLDSADSAKCTTAASGDSANAGEWIEALAAYNSISSSDSTKELLRGTFDAAMTNKEWHTSEQILQYHPESLMSNLNLPRGLTTYYQRNTTSEVRKDIEKYLAVQYNAILDQGTVSGSNLYSPKWTETASTQSDLDVDAQIAAQQVLITAISLSYSRAGSPGTVGPPPGHHSGSADSKSKALVGGVVGGVIGLVILLLGIWFAWRRRRRNQNLTKVVRETRVARPYEVRTEPRAIPPAVNNSEAVVLTPTEKAPITVTSPSTTEAGDSLSDLRSISGGGQSTQVRTHLNEEVQRLQLDMEHVLRVLSQRSAMSPRDSEGEGMEDLPPPPEYPGNDRGP